MKNKFLKYSLLSALSIASLTSCNLDERFQELNTNPNNPTVVSSDALLTGLESRIFNTIGGFQNEKYYGGDGYIGFYSQHFAGDFSNGLDASTYQITNTTFSTLFVDSYLYSLKDAERLISLATPDYAKHKAVAKILTAHKLGYLTTIFGDIPYKEALSDEKTLSPKYDSQESIYQSIQSLLSQAIAELEASPNAQPLKGDFIYNGDVGSWKALAYMLSARFHNHLSKKDPAGSAAKALAAIDKAKALGFISNASNLLAKYEGTPNFYNPWVDTYGNGAIAANKPFIDRLVSEADPRLDKLFADKDRDGNACRGIGRLQSLRAGSGAVASLGGDNSAYGQRTSSIPVASYAEMLMIEAEAAFRANDKDRAATAYNEAIKADIGSVTGNVSSAAATAYITAKTATAANISIENIMTEKHKVMFAMSVESWTDFRRHDNKFPTWAKLPLNASETATIGDVKGFIQRALYPQTELNLNGANVPKVDIYKKLWIVE